MQLRMYTCTMVQTRKRKPRPPASPKLAASCCGPLDSALDPELFRALGDPTRVLLLACLAKCGRACSVGEVAECCSVDLSVVSRHLSQLADAGILESSKQGRTVFYRVRYAEVCRSLRSLADAFETCCGDTSTKGACCGTC